MHTFIDITSNTLDATHYNHQNYLVYVSSNTVSHVFVHLTDVTFITW